MKDNKQGFYSKHCTVAMINAIYHIVVADTELKPVVCGGFEIMLNNPDLNRFI